MYCLMRPRALVILLAAGVLLAWGTEARSQNGRCQGRQSGQAGGLAPSQMQSLLRQQATAYPQLRFLQRTGQLTPAQLQNLQQNQVAQLQGLLLQLQTAQLGAQASPQVQALLQQQIAQVQLLLLQLQSY